MNANVRSFSHRERREPSAPKPVCGIYDLESPRRICHIVRERRTEHMNGSRQFSSTESSPLGAMQQHNPGALKRKPQPFSLNGWRSKLQKLEASYHNGESKDRESALAHLQLVDRLEAGKETIA